MTDEDLDAALRRLDAEISITDEWLEEMLAADEEDRVAVYRLGQWPRLTDAQFERVLARIAADDEDGAAGLRRLRALRCRLAEVDAAEAIALAEGDELCTGPSWRWGVASRQPLDVATAQRAAALFGALPHGEQARCHLPPYALRLIAAGRELAVAALCFRCSNASIGTPDGAAWLAFDPRSPAAVELLDLLRDAVGRRGE